MTIRRLKNNEKTLWNKVARTVSPRRRNHGHKSAKPYPPVASNQEEFANLLRLPPQNDHKAFKIKPEIELNRDKKTRRGQIAIEATIDLHDMTQVKAFQVLQNAIISASNRNHSCILVITGKGLSGAGILRQSLPRWVNDPALRPLIASYAQAHIRHGGSGAWYIFIKS